MLKRLQLVGFKSFADKTDFDFSPGVTAVVGPNGSGKSNIVDGIKWVLGEQSAKSLRGSEMSDVIFNGSASRRSLGLAEVSLTFDNSKHVLASPHDEIQITRRVYRSGEGEYLINNQLSRLKDIKDLFLGSGAGTDAYCIIEQGRVDVLLQASTKERRTIFEEAAGISRFRARKTETLRKLERVDGNLTRLKDIMDEVEKQLRSVRLQAAKAQRFKEHSERLKELRVGQGLRQYGDLAAQLAEATVALDTLQRDSQQGMEQAERQEQALEQSRQALAQLDGAIAAEDARLNEAREQIAKDRAVLNQENTRAASLEADFERDSAEVLDRTRKAASRQEALAAATGELAGLQAAADAARLEHARLDAARAETERHLQRCQEAKQRGEDEVFGAMQQEANLNNEANNCRRLLDQHGRERERHRLRSSAAVGEVAALEQNLAQTAVAEQEVQARLAAAQQASTASQAERERLQGLLEQTVQREAQLRADRSGLESRIEVLERLERSHEGMDTGVREVLALLERDDPGPWRSVLGIVADFFTVPREYAPLIDLALGARAHQFIVRDAARLNEALATRTEPFSGRVSFVLLTPNQDNLGRPNRLLEPSAAVRVRMPGGHPAHPGVVALAEDVVTCELPELEGLPRRLLARTVLVRDLDGARALAALTTGYRFVTLQGELLEADGTLTVGTHHAESGLLSRRSELRELRENVVELATRLTDLADDISDLRNRITGVDAEVRQQQQEIEGLKEQARDLRATLTRQRETLEGLHETVAVSRQDIERLDREIHEGEQRWGQLREEAALASERVKQVQAAIAEAKEGIRQLEQASKDHVAAFSAAMVTLAQANERLEAQGNRVTELERDYRTRDQERRQGELTLVEQRRRLEDSQRKALAAASSLALRCHEREQAEAVLQRLRGEHGRLTQEVERWSAELKGVRQQRDKRSSEERDCALKVRDLKHRLDLLVRPLQDDYQLDLASLHAETPPTPAETPTVEPAEVDAEIDEIRKKLARLGSVNMEALRELEELEMREGALRTQFDDLSAAKKSLTEIIDRINTDSRKLFTDTLTTIRIHFQELFRKLFAGGQADIVLEDETDVLETGIEIIARPPGKELRSISLMSGGEKTLTAVALLLAIFRSKPSPFCILDEVDAALDEANIGRLAAVIREFLQLSQFIMITHSKRTMSAADVLYGVTMQESGISKRVAVRFEDWPDDERKPQNQAS